jgi:hypothetical protein
MIEDNISFTVYDEKRLILFDLGNKFDNKNYLSSIILIVAALM